MLWLALKALFHKKGRFFITLLGIAFSTILTITQIAIYLGMMGNATAIIRHTDADIWVTSKNIQNFDFANPYPEERINRVRAMPDVEWSEKIILLWGFLKLPNGGIEQVQVLGFNPDTGVSGPWSMIAGEPLDVKGGKFMILDQSAEQRLGKLEIGKILELNGRRFKLVGLSSGIRSFTTAPFVFVSYKDAQALLPDMDGMKQTAFIAVKLHNRENIPRVIKMLQSGLKNNDVYTQTQFILKTVFYWTVETGMGMGFFLTALLGLIVGTTIVGQTIYTSTMEYSREFGTLKALGAKNGDIYTVIFGQASVSVVIGYLLGALLIALLSDPIESAGVSLYLSPVLFVTVFLIILLSCLCSAYFSVRKVRTLDPAIVFKA